MGIQVGGEIFSYNQEFILPETGGTLATQEYVQQNGGGGGGGAATSLRLEAPNGSIYEVTVDNNGVLSTTLIP